MSNLNGVKKSGQVKLSADAKRSDGNSILESKLFLIGEVLSLIPIMLVIVGLFLIPTIIYALDANKVR